VHSVSQRPNLRHLCESLGGTESLVKKVGFEKMTECMWRRTSANARREWVTDRGKKVLDIKTILLQWMGVLLQMT